MAETEIIKPYEGPPPSPENFSRAYPQMETAIKKGVNNLDAESQANLNEFMQTMRANPPKPATVVNLHPWPLAFGYGNRLLRGFTVPACEPGQICNFLHIRNFRKDWEQNENGSLKFKPVTPIQIAAEFVREYANKDNDGGGVLIYLGESNPLKAGNVECYDSLGRQITNPKQGIETDEEGNKVPVMFQEPVFKPFDHLLKEAITIRNQVYLRKVQRADHDYNLPDGRGKRNVHDKHLLMAEVLYAEGIIKDLPKWDLSTKIDEGFSQNNCKACGGNVREGAYRCTNCGNILNVVEAFRDGAVIPEAKFANCTHDELEQIEEIKAERIKATEERAKAVEEHGKAKGKKANPDAK